MPIANKTRASSLLSRLLGKSGVIALAVVLGGLVCYAIYVFAYTTLDPAGWVKSRDWGGEVENVFLAPANEPTILIFEEAAHGKVRTGRTGSQTIRAKKLSVFDLHDGGRTAVATDSPDTRCLGVAAGALWCTNPKIGLHARSIKTAETVRAEGEVLASRPDLAGRLLRDYGAFTLDEKKGFISLSTRDGYRYALDANNGSIVDQKTVSLEPTDHSSYTSNRATVKLNGVEYSFDGSPRGHLVKNSPRGSSSLQPLSDRTYLDPSFMWDWITGKAIQFDTPEGLLIQHSSSLSQQGSPDGILLSRITLQGDPAWTHTFKSKGGEIKEAYIRTVYVIADGILILLDVEGTGSNKHKKWRELLMLDRRDGSVRWQTLSRNRL